MEGIIAIVEDDPDQRQNYIDALERRGYQVESYSSQNEALTAFSKHLPDMAILDIMLGADRDGGFNICRELQRLSPGLPVIFLSSRSDDIDRISGLRLGACDYLSKPVTLEFLGELVNALFRLINSRTSTTPSPNRLSHGSISIDIDRAEVYWKTKPVAFTITEFNMLTLLINNINKRGVSYDQLIDLTSDGDVYNNAINSHIKNIRKKFREYDPDFDCIKNIHGYGYCWRGS